MQTHPVGATCTRPREDGCTCYSAWLFYSTRGFDESNLLHPLEVGLPSIEVSEERDALPKSQKAHRGSALKLQPVLSR